jgi:hypothetical protein
LNENLGEILDVYFENLVSKEGIHHEIYAFDESLEVCALIEVSVGLVEAVSVF